MGKQLVSDELWQRIEPLLPPEKPRRFRFPGRKPLDRRKVLSGIIFVLKSGISWDDLPAELGWGCGRTCRETLAAWQQAGVWQQLHELLLAELNEADRIDWSRVLIDSATVKAPKGGDQTGPNPTDRRKKRKQTPPGHRRQGGSPGDQADWRQPARRDPVDPLDRCHPGGPRPPWPTATPAPTGPSRSRVRLGREAARVAAPGHQAGTGTSQHGARQRPRRIPLVCRADIVVGAPVPTPGDPMGSTPRNPVGLDVAGLLSHLSEALTVDSPVHFFR
jgi:transposase